MYKIRHISALVLLPVATGCLLAFSAIPSDYYYLNFIAFIPLLIAADETLKNKRPVLIFACQLFITLVVFYLWVGHWVLKTANLGFLLGLLIVLPFVLMVSPYLKLKQRGYNRLAPVYFVAGWVSAEWLQSYFQLGSPFYNLGNSLGRNPRLIQWYEYTGASGGTIWILAVNFLLFSLGNALFSDRKQLTKQSLWAFGVLSVPIILSVIIYRSYKEKGAAKEVLIIHPSTDCSDVKYRVNIYELMDNYLKVMLPQLTSKTEYVVLPETAITNAGWVADLNNNLVFDHFREATAAFTGLKLVTGAIIYESIPDITRIKGYQRNPGIRYSEKYKAWYYTYNSALFIEKNFPVQMRTKDGLVPYQEYAPYPGILPKLSPVGIDFQFSKREKNRVVFTDENRVKTASLICYELAYGNFFAKAVRNGAQAFFVLMNEGWYVSEPKVKYQFLQLSVVRAIENRRDIAHASNMGISAFVDQRGIIVAQNNSITPSFLKQEIRMNKQHTMASAMGNYPAAIALVTVTILMISELIRKTSLQKKL